jgi:hypothetical protein
MQMNTNVFSDQNPAPQPTLREMIVARWRRVGGPAVVWATVGSLAGAAMVLPSLTQMIPVQGYLAWLVRGILPGFLSAFILIVALTMSVGSGTEMSRRPFWFTLVLASGSAAATCAVWVIDLYLPSQNDFPLGNRLMDIWLTIMLFGGIFGWAAVLNVRRTEEHAALTELLVRRSLLARRVAQARLFAARAQVDPEMVARVLSRVRARYRGDAEEAAALLDQLIAYLRLAMNRQGVQRTPLGGELDMIRSYITLREAETGGRIALQINLSQDVQQLQPAAAPFFLLVRHCMAEANPAPELLLQLDIASNRLQLTMESGAALMEEQALQRLRGGLREIFAGRDEVDILHHLLDSGVHRYVVQAAID